MSLAAWSVSALVLAIIVSCVTNLNVGVLAIALAWIVGVTPPTTEQLLALLITNGNVRTNPS